MDTRIKNYAQKGTIAQTYIDTTAYPSVSHSQGPG